MYSDLASEEPLGKDANRVTFSTTLSTPSPTIVLAFDAEVVLRHKASFSCASIQDQNLSRPEAVDRRQFQLTSTTHFRA